MLSSRLISSAVFICLFSGLPFGTRAQEPLAGLQPGASLSSVYKLYMNSVGKAAHFYTGSAYTARYVNAKGSAFFDAFNYQPADLSLSGVLYYQIPLKYDLVTQRVVVNGPDGEPISLPEEKIDSFYLNGHVFVRLHADGSSIGQFPEAFYDRLYAGVHGKLYIQRTRVLHQSLRAEDPAVFDLYDTYFIYKDDRYFPVTSQRSVQRILGLSGQQLKFDAGRNRLNWKRDPEKLLRAAIEIYDMSMK